MPRNLDMTTLRSFAAVAETGGVTKAAGFLNLTQSAVSMQLKRLEDSLGVVLLDRSARQISLTATGEQLLSYARRILLLNDEAFDRLTSQNFEGEITLGVPHDIVYPAIPQVLQRFSADFPRMRVQLVSSVTRKLREQFSQGAIDMILTTEDSCGEGGETLEEKHLVWIGAPGGTAWKSRPLRLAYEHNCVFRGPVQKALDQAEVDWEMAVESDSTRTIEAAVSADLAVHTVIEGMEPPHVERIQHGGALPELHTVKINFYLSELARGPADSALADLVRQAYRGFSRSLSQRPSRLTAGSAATPTHLRPVPTAGHG